MTEAIIPLRAMNRHTPTESLSAASHEPIRSVGGVIGDRVRRLREAAAIEAGIQCGASDWGNFSNVWGNSPTFDNFDKFYNGYS